VGLGKRRIEVLDWLKSKGDGQLSWINEILRERMAGSVRGVITPIRLCYTRMTWVPSYLYASAIVVAACYWSEFDGFQYPKTKHSSQVDEYHGVKVADPYRWLEDDTSPEVQQWVKDQNKVTFAYY